eukprot:6479309-Amphidinium_carterae.1
MAYVEQIPTSPVEQSPTSPVYSAAPSTSAVSEVSPNLLETSPAEALEIFFKPLDDIPEYTQDTINQWWSHDPQEESFKMLCPTWLDKVKNFLLINGYTMLPGSAPE